MIKLLALDIDDTLTASPAEIPPENAAAIRRAQEAGVYVTVATGRGYFGSRVIWEPLGIKGPVINYGGAIVNDTRTGKAVYETALAPSEVTELLELARRLGVHAQLYQGDSVIFERENEYSKRYRSRLKLPYRIEPDIRAMHWENVPKVLFITENARAEELIPRLGREYEGRIKVSGSVAGFIEFNNASAHKGSALAWLAGEMGLGRHEVAAMGDNLLDIEMIEWAGVGAAVGNAHREILDAADVIAPPCDEFGVAWFIDNAVLKGE